MHCQEYEVFGFLTALLIIRATRKIESVSFFPAASAAGERKVKGTQFPCEAWGKAPTHPQNSWISRFRVRMTGMEDKKRIISMPICEADGKRKVQGTQFPAGGLGAEPPT